MPLRGTVNLSFTFKGFHRFTLVEVRPTSTTTFHTSIFPEAFDQVSGSFPVLCDGVSPHLRSQISSTCKHIPMQCSDADQGSPPNLVADNGVNTNGAAAKIVNFDRLRKNVHPGTFGKTKVV